MSSKKKFFLLTTVPMTLNFFKEQLSALNALFDVTVISSPGKQLYDIAEREGVKFKAIKMKREISLFNDVISFFKLFIFFLQEKPSVIHCNTPKASLLGLVAGKLASIPNRIYYIHGLRYEGAVGIKQKILVTMEKISCFCATEIIAVSKGVQEIVTRDLTSKKVKIIRYGSANGIIIQDFLEFSSKPEELKFSLGITHKDFVFGYVGRLVGDKGINELVSAFVELNSQYPNTKLLLVGFYEENLDPLFRGTTELIKSHNSIIEIGFQKDVKKYLSIMNIFVSPSYREGFGQSLLEANLMGIPVVASSITGYKEIVEEGKNGFLIPSKDRDTLFSKMKEVYINSDELRSMTVNCREIVRERYDHLDVLKDAIEYYREFKDQ